MKPRKTGFDRYFGSRTKEPRFASAYASARAGIDAIDQLVRALDAVRIDRGMSKAELARRIAAKPEIIRRLFTNTCANPTITTVLEVAKALGMRLALVPNRSAAANKRAAVG